MFQNPSPTSPLQAAWRRRGSRWLFLAFLLIGIAAGQSGASARSAVQFQVSLQPSLVTNAQDGRLFVILDNTNSPEPRLRLGDPSDRAPQAFARDVQGFKAGNPMIIGRDAFGFPFDALSKLPAGDYYVQALLSCNQDLRRTDAPGNLYSLPRRVRLDQAASATIQIELSRRLPPDELPVDTDQVKFLKVESKLLSRFFGRPIYLRAGILLPRDYGQDASKRYPLWVRIGGLNTRYTAVTGLLREGSSFRRTWLADDTPRFLLLQLDGAGPYGDPYYVNSANNGPYGDGLTRELIPEVERRFHAMAQPAARVLSGTSTGGWVALALQVFNPDYFNGAWSSCPDPVDFRALQLVNLYADSNAYVDHNGKEQPSERNLDGQVVLTMLRETAMENLLGRDNSYTFSGEQWGAWNAVFSPQGPDGQPARIWDAQTGKIDPMVAEHWKKYDLRLILERDWKTLGPKLHHKIHIASGEADQYYLNNAVHLLDAFLAHADPPFEGKIVYGPGKGHGWFDLSLRQMLLEMDAAVKRGVE